MRMIIDELVTILGLDIAAGVLPKIQQFEGMLKDVARTVGIVSTGIVTAASGIAYFAERMNRTTFQLAKLGQLSGLNTDEIQKMQMAAVLAGGSIEGMGQDLMSLNESMNPAIPGEYNHALMMFFAGTGVAADQLKDSVSSFDEMNKRMQDFPQSARVQWARKINLGESATLLVTKDREDYIKTVERAQKIGVLISKAELDNVKKFIIELDTVKEIISKIGQKVSAVAGPAMEKLVGNLTDWVIKEKEFIQLGLQTTIDGILEGFTKFGKTLSFVKGMFVGFKDTMKQSFPEFDKFLKWLDKMHIVSAMVYAALGSLAAIFIGMGASLLLSHPVITLVFGALTALALFLNSETGGQWIEYIGKKFEGFGEKVKATIELVKEWIEQMDDAKEKERAINEAKGKDSGFLGKFLNDPGEALAYLFASKGNKRGMVFDKFLSSQFHSAPLLGPTVANNANNQNQFSLIQNINGDNAMAIASEAKRGMQDFISQTYPGMFTQVAN